MQTSTQPLCHIPVDTTVDKGPIPMHWVIANSMNVLLKVTKQENHNIGLMTCIVCNQALLTWQQCLAITVYV
jgi:hypothetical protein